MFSEAGFDEKQINNWANGTIEAYYIHTHTHKQGLCFISLPVLDDRIWLQHSSVFQFRPREQQLSGVSMPRHTLIQGQKKQTTAAKR